jgi:hypothetical protein
MKLFEFAQMRRVHSLYPAIVDSGANEGTPGSILP